MSTDWVLLAGILTIEIDSTSQSQLITRRVSLSDTRNLPHCPGINSSPFAFYFRRPVHTRIYVISIFIFIFTCVSDTIILISDLLSKTICISQCFSYPQLNSSCELIFYIIFVLPRLCSISFECNILFQVFLMISDDGNVGSMTPRSNPAKYKRDQNLEKSNPP
jgi:hypothetical protein